MITMGKLIWDVRSHFVKGDIDWKEQSVEMYRMDDKYVVVVDNVIVSLKPDEYITADKCYNRLLSE